MAMVPVKLPAVGLWSGKVSEPPIWEKPLPSGTPTLAGTAKLGHHTWLAENEDHEAGMGFLGTQTQSFIQAKEPM